MDEYPSKRVTGGFGSRRASGSVLRDSANNTNRDAQYCNRIGCSGRLNSMKGTRSRCSEKLKSPLQSLRTSSSGKETVGSSSRSYYAVRDCKKSEPRTQRKPLGQLEAESSETSSVQDEPETSQTSSRSSDSADVKMTETGRSGVSSNTRGRRDFTFSRRTGTRNEETSASSSVFVGPKRAGPATGAGVGRRTLSNLKCNSISDVIPSGCSSSDPNLRKLKDTAKKRNSEAESSSSRGKKMNGLSTERVASSGYGVSISDSRGPRNGTSQMENGIGLGRTRTAINGISRERGHRNRSERNGRLLREQRGMIPQLSQSHQPDSSIDNNELEISSELISSRPISYRRSDSNGENIHSYRPASPAEAGSARSSTSRESFRHYGIAEVLLALERIEHDEELTYEQVILLETNLFLSGLNFYDQHRDMRLDIDNMSYEELLALEERMGSVSTALTEEAILECLNRGKYQASLSDDTSAGHNDYDDDIKCCICQEEYSNGEEIGTLQCEHTYHSGCIQQWLRLKNWCPICKASVEPPPSSSTAPSPS